MTSTRLPPNAESSYAVTSFSNRSVIGGASKETRYGSRGLNAPSRGLCDDKSNPTKKRVSSALSRRKSAVASTSPSRCPAAASNNGAKWRIPAMFWKCPAVHSNATVRLGGRSANPRANSNSAAAPAACSAPGANAGTGDTAS